MNKKKIISAGFFAVVLIIGAGVAYYCYPSAINSALGINSAAVDGISGNDPLAMDDASSSLAAIDPSDGDTDAPVDAQAAASPKASAPEKKSAATQQPVAASVPVPSKNGNDTAITTSSLPAPSVVSSTPAAAPTSSTPVSAPLQNIIPIENSPENNFTSLSSDANTVVSTSVETSTVQSAAATSTDAENNIDNAASSSGSVDNNATDTNTLAIPTTGASSHVLITAVQIAGASSSNDLVKLYNPTTAAIDMSGWKLHKKSSTGTDYSLKVFSTGSVIGAGESFVWANADGGFSEAVDANVSSTESLAADNSVALMDAAGNIVDAVAWGTGADQYGEGPSYPTSPGANQLLSRRSADGLMVDTQNNSSDFTIQ